MNSEIEFYRRYAGFWKRFLANIIDGLILSAIRSIFFIPLLIFAAFSFSPYFDEGYEENFVNVVSFERLPDPATSAMIFLFFGITFLIFTVSGWLYYAFMESSKKQATFGKVVLSIKVTDLEGKRISFGRASGRYFAKIISTMFFYLGYIIAAFTEKKQALHDIIAGCIIVDTTAEIMNELNSKKDFNNI